MLGMIFWLLRTITFGTNSPTMLQNVCREFYKFGYCLDQTGGYFEFNFLGWFLFPFSFFLICSTFIIVWGRCRVNCLYLTFQYLHISLEIALKRAMIVRKYISVVWFPFKLKINITPYLWVISLHAIKMLEIDFIVIWLLLL